MKKYKTTCATACLLWLVLLLAALPLSVGAAGQSVTLVQGGVEMEIPLPAAFRELDQPQPHRALGETNGVQVALELENSSVEEKARLEERAYNSLAWDCPGTTRFEELPDLTEGDVVFTVRKLVYAGESGEPAAALTAFCRVNHRYIYVVTLRGEGGVDAEMLRQFTGHTVTANRLRPHGATLAPALIELAVGLFFILRLWNKKHRWPRAVGTIEEGAWRWPSSVMGVQVSYQRPDGTFCKGTFTTVGGSSYSQRTGQQVDIAYSPKNPQKVEILSSKAEYGIYVLLLVLAARGIYLAFFVM